MLFHLHQYAKWRSYTKTKKTVPAAKRSLIQILLNSPDITSQGTVNGFKTDLCDCILPFGV